MNEDDSERLVTFKEICAFAGLSHNPVSRRIKLLGINVVKKAGHGGVNMYRYEDMLRVKEFRTKNPGKTLEYYRVNILVGNMWVVCHAGQTLREAKALVQDYAKNGVMACYRSCRGNSVQRRSGA